MHRDLPLARQGAPRCHVRRILTLGVVLTLSTLTWAQSAGADDLDDQKDRVNRQIQQTQRELGESNKRLGAAATRLQESQAKLDIARAELDRTRKELAAAQSYDQQMANKLHLAQEESKKAQERVSQGKLSLAAQQVVVGDVARYSYQNYGDLLPIAVLAQDESLGDLQTRMQWSETMQAGSEADMDRLRKVQAELDAAEAEQARIEQQVSADREAAAKALAHSQALADQASEQEANVTKLVVENSAAKQAAEREVAADKSQYQQSTNERAAVEKRIAERIARQQAAEKARREAEARRAEQQRQAEAARRAAAARKASTSSSKSSAKSAAARKSTTTNRRTSSAKTSSSSAGLVYPVSAPITSPFGMRFHPVLHYWKLHDGMDFGASCGTPIRAVAAGVVTERYFNVGYGNRLMVDHGKVAGRFLSTSYNHLSRYAVSAGQRVEKGQIIGYAGTTGYSTGCHLHFMAWVNGKLVNPVTIF